MMILDSGLLFWATLYMYTVLADYMKVVIAYDRMYIT